MSDSKLRFDDQSLAEEVTWRMRLSDMQRAGDRDILNRTFNGEPPFDKATAEENNIEVNRNFLEGTGTLTDARTQWNSNFLKPGNIFTVHVDCKDPQVRRETSTKVTKHLNRLLKNSLPMVNQSRETGAGVLLHGIGPTNWADRRSLVPKVVPLSSLLIPSETDIDFDNLEYFALFREMTPAQLYDKTHGPKVDPGWNLDLVDAELEFAREQVIKQPNMTSLQYMPERITEIRKQDIGFWGSDAVPTIDYWDFYFRDMENGTGWYRRIFLDWGSSARETGIGSGKNAPKPPSPNKAQWLYSSKDKVYADNWQQILHVNYGDCSCVAPFRYHSVRSLGWMIWGIVDIQNRLRCKITEQAFSELMWFFRTANANDFNRIKRANFLQMGVIPQGIDWVKANERYSPNPTYIDLVLRENRALMAQHSASFTRNSDRTVDDKAKTATQVLAEVNSINTLVSGVMTMAYTYEAFKYKEICRRACIPNNPDPLALKFRELCAADNVDPKYLDYDRWDVEPERAMGSGNKTVQMAIVQYLNSIRQNLGPDAQRKVDNMGIEIMTEDAIVAEELAPVKSQQQMSDSMHDAELATERLLRGLPFSPPRQAIFEDYVQVWLRDMTQIIGQIQQSGAVGTPEQLAGLQNMAQHVGQFLQFMGQNKADGPKVRQYSDMLGQLMNLVKGFAQRLQQQMAAGNGQGNGGMDPETMGKIQAELVKANAKAANTRESHAQRTAQRQVSFELEQQRKDREAAADIRRKQLAADVELQSQSAKTQQELMAEAIRNTTEAAKPQTTPEE